MFVGLVLDIKKIKKNLASQDPKYWFNEYNKSMYLGREEKAIFALQEYVWLSLERSKSKMQFEVLKAKHEDDFLRAGEKFPIFPY